VAYVAICHREAFNVAHSIAQVDVALYLLIFRRPTRKGHSMRRIGPVVAVLCFLNAGVLLAQSASDAGTRATGSFKDTYSSPGPSGSAPESNVKTSPQGTYSTPPNKPDAKAAPAKTSFQETYTASPSKDAGR
jgi:hypothetical protein